MPSILIKTINTTCVQLDTSLKAHLSIGDVVDAEITKRVEAYLNSRRSEDMNALHSVQVHFEEQEMHELVAKYRDRVTA